MKRVVTFVVVFCFLIILFGCSNKSSPESTTREYKSLTKEQVLVLSTGERFANNTTTEESDSYLTKIIARTYNLVKSSSQTNFPGEVQYQSYWYRITSTQTTDQELLGKRTVAVDTNYAYLIYTEDESLSVKTTTVTKTTFDYKGGWVERYYQRTINLNGYFASEEELYSVIPEFASQIDSDNIEKYYIDVTVPTATITNYQQVNTFYYFDKLNSIK